MGQITLNHLQAITLMEALGESVTDGETTLTGRADGALVVATPESTTQIETDGSLTDLEG